MRSDSNPKAELGRGGSVVPLWVSGVVGSALVVYGVSRDPVAALAAAGVQAAVAGGAQWLTRKRSAASSPSFVVWFTGLSGSGKSTLAEALFDRLRLSGHRVEMLDGDRLRDLYPGVGFTRAQREEHLVRAGFLASYLERQGHIVVASFISPYASARDAVRGMCKNFVEVHVDTPLEICEGRDVKGLYARARAGEIRNFTGIDDPYEVPRNPEIRVTTAGLSQEESLGQVLAFIGKYLDKEKANGSPQGA